MPALPPTMADEDREIAATNQARPREIGGAHLLFRVRETNNLDGKMGFDICPAETCEAIAKKVGGSLDRLKMHLVRCQQKGIQMIQGA